MATKKFRLTNLGTKTVDEIIEFLGFDGTETERRSCSVALSRGSEDNFAIVVVPENMAVRVKDRDGTPFGNLTINIEEIGSVTPLSADAMEAQESITGSKSSERKGALPTSSSQSQSTLDTLAQVVANATPLRSAEDQVIEHVHEYILIDTTRCNDCYSVPSHATVVYALGVQFPKIDDPDRILLRQWGQSEGTWKIETQNINIYKDVRSLIHEHREIGTIEVKRDVIYRDNLGNIRKKTTRAHEITSEEENDGTDRKYPDTDLLITLYQANTKRFSSVKNEDLLQEIVNMGIGHLKKAPQAQKYKGTDELNGNKFFVLSNVSETDAKKIPPSFKFLDNHYGWQEMWLNHRYRKRLCSFCGVEHEAACPTKELYNKLKLERKQWKDSLPNQCFEAHIMSDSIMRYAEQECVAVDVHVMTGGTTGNLLNAVDIDIEHREVNNLILVTGQNELTAELTDEEFLLVMKNKEQRLKTLAAQKNVAILKPPPQEKLDPVEQAKEILFHEHLNYIEENNPNIKVWPNPIQTYQENGGRHPSPEQTQQILKYIDLKAREDLGVSIFLKSGENDLVVSKKKYGGVKSLYKYGCGACPDKGRNKWWLLCSTCSGKARAPDENHLSKALHILYEKARAIRDTENPVLTNQDQTKDYRERSPLKNNDCPNNENEEKDRISPAKRVRLFDDE